MVEAVLPRITFGQIEAWCKGTRTLSRAVATRPVASAWMDSRKIGQGDLFVAIEAENDGHDFVLDALQKGATAAIVSKKKMARFSKQIIKRLIGVSDTVLALQRVGREYRKTLKSTIVAITGSNGKTTTRSFMANVLGAALPVGETSGNFNNHLGLPLSLLRFTGNEAVDILEMGANHSGEIHTLSAIARPDVAIITNIGYGHIGLFGSLDAITDAKFEIVDGMQKKGRVLLNGDDHRLVRGAAKRKIDAYFFGFSPRCDIRARNVAVNNQKTEFSVDDEHYAIPMIGRHFVYCVLPAIWMAKQLAIDAETVRAALLRFVPVTMRGTIEQRRGAKIIVDCYNANPSSMKAALQVLCDVAGRSPKVAIVGDMLELGKFSKRLHIELGCSLAKAGVDRILAVGNFADQVANAAYRSGFAPKKIFTAINSEQAIGIAARIVKSGDTVLLKGSRGIGLEKVLEGL